MDKKINIPFLKWPGGKRWFVKSYLDIFPKDYNNYYEPFLGGGSVFFALQPANGMLTDVNEELINTYVVMRDYPDKLRNIMLQHQQNHCNEYYYIMRNQSYTRTIEGAARFLYLNRTCFNGMYRVNKNGIFNVPIGTRDNCIADIELFEEYAKLLKGMQITTADFEVIIKKAKAGDLIFADPPYAVQKKQDGFIKYNDKLFTWADQERLCRCLSEANERGVYVVLTNVNTV